MPHAATELLLVVSAIGLIAAAVLRLSPLPRWARGWVPSAVLAATALAPALAVGRTEALQASGRGLLEWTAVGGPTVHAAYHVDALAAIGVAAIALTCGAALLVVASSVSRLGLAALACGQAIALFALVAVNDLVAGVVVAGLVAVLTFAVGMGIGPAPAAARFAALLAFGVQGFVASAVLLGRFGIGTFDLDAVPPDAISPGVLLTAMLAAALFCGLYPFVPWRYEPAAARSTLFTLRGAIAFPTGIAGTVFALRLIGATQAPPETFLLPQGDPFTRGLLSLAILALALATFRRIPPGARRPHLIAAIVVSLVVLFAPALRWGHVVALLALATVAYASVASAALPEEWAVARFDARLGALWAAIAIGTPVALAAALLGAVAGALALVVEVAPLPHHWLSTSRAIARVLVAFGPLLALGGLFGATDWSIALLAGATLLWAGGLEIAHAVRAVKAEGWIPRNERWFAALCAYAVALLFVLVVGPTAARASRVALAAAVADLPLAGVAAVVLLLAALTAAVVVLPERVRLGVPRGAPGAVRATLGAVDPVPAALFFYGGIETWTTRVSAAFALLEDRAGVWLATLVIALALLWAATT